VDLEPVSFFVIVIDLVQFSFRSQPLCALVFLWELYVTGFDGSEVLEKFQGPQIVQMDHAERLSHSVGNDE
jgi:hypothetical protein